MESWLELENSARHLLTFGDGRNPKINFNFGLVWDDIGARTPSNGANVDTGSMFGVIKPIQIENLMGDFFNGVDTLVIVDAGVGRHSLGSNNEITDALAERFHGSSRQAGLQNQNGFAFACLSFYQRT